MLNPIRLHHNIDGDDATNKWFLDMKGGSLGTSRCISCKSIIHWCFLHIYTFEYLYIPYVDKVIRAKLRYCATSSCAQSRANWKRVNSEQPERIELIQKPPMLISREEMDYLKDEGFNVVTPY